MRLGILSDTHDELDRTIRAVRLLRDAGADAIVHCGDITGPAILRVCAAVPCWFVFGNNDSDSVPALREAAANYGAICLGWGDTFEIGARRVGVVHGHMTSDVRRVLSQRPEFLLSGHSHIPTDVTVDGVRRINPGALHRADTLTVAVLELPGGALRTLDVGE